MIELIYNCTQILLSSVEFHFKFAFLLAIFIYKFFFNKEFRVTFNHASLFNVYMYVCMLCLLVLVSTCFPALQRGSAALITQNSQWMLRPVYTHHNKLHSPPSLLPQQAFLSVCLVAYSHSLLQRSFYLQHFIMHQRETVNCLLPTNTHRHMVYRKTHPYTNIVNASRALSKFEL